MSIRYNPWIMALSTYSIDTWSNQDANYPISNIQTLNSQTLRWQTTDSKTNATVIIKVDAAGATRVGGFAFIGANFTDVWAVGYDSTSLSTKIYSTQYWTLNVDWRRQANTTYYHHDLWLQCTHSSAVPVWRFIIGNPVYNNFLRLHTLAVVEDATRDIFNFPVQTFTMQCDYKHKIIEKLNGNFDIYKLSNWKQYEVNIDFAPFTATDEDNYERYLAMCPSSGHVAIFENNASYSKTVHNQYVYICKPFEQVIKASYNVDGFMQIDPIKFREVV